MRLKVKCAHISIEFVKLKKKVFISMTIALNCYVCESTDPTTIATDDIFCFCDIFMEISLCVNHFFFSSLNKTNDRQPEFRQIKTYVRSDFIEAKLSKAFLYWLNSLHFISLKNKNNAINLFYANDNLKMAQE